MQRDIYDLYHIHKKESDVLAIEEQKIFKKIESGRLATSRLDKYLLRYCCLDAEGMVWIIDKLKKLV